MIKYDVNIRGDVFAEDPVAALNTIIDWANRVKNSEDIEENMRNGESFNVDLNFAAYKEDE